MILSKKRVELLTFLSRSLKIFVKFHSNIRKIVNLPLTIKRNIEFFRLNSIFSKIILIIFLDSDFFFT